MKNFFTFLFFAALFAGHDYAYADNAIVLVGDDGIKPIVTQLGGNGADIFVPEQVTIFAGEMVTWQWVSGIHTIKSDSSPEEWAEVPSDSAHAVYSHVFNSAGTFPYHSSIQGYVMSGTVVVLARTTGLRDNQYQSRLLDLYPNPAQAQLKVALKQVGASNNFEMKLTNLTGQVVKSVSAETLKGAANKEIELNIADLPAGLYFFTLYRDDKFIESKRVLIQK